MVKQKSIYNRDAIRNKRRAILQDYGGMCAWAGCNEIKDLEFAHVLKTELSGRSRGSSERISDVANHPASYMPLCPKHHKEYDKNG